MAQLFDWDSDIPVIAQPSALAVVEGNSGTSNVVVTLHLDHSVPYVSSVHYSTAGKTASAGSDFTKVTGTATFAAYSTTTTISIPVAGDTVLENSETLTLILNAPSNANVVEVSPSSRCRSRSSTTRYRT